MDHFVRKIQNVRLFSEVGRHDLSAWREAIQSAQGGAWEAVCEEVANLLREDLAAREGGVLRGWNRMIDRLRQGTDYSIGTEEVANRLVAEFGPPEVLPMVKWDFLHIAASEETGIDPHGFYAGVATAYLDGLYPCGWSGVFPNGHLILF